MSEKMSNLTKEVEREYKVPEEVINADWRDDVPEELESEDAQVKFEFFENEAGYENDPTDDGEDSGEKIRAFHKKIGMKTRKLYNLRKAV